MEAVAASLIVIGHSIGNVFPNPVYVLVVMAFLSFRLREGSWTAIGLGWPQSWLRTVLMALAAAIIQQAVGQLVVDPLIGPFLHYSAQANPLESAHNIPVFLQWLGIIWTLAAFGEEIVWRGYILNRVADIGGQSHAALVAGLLWSSVMFGCTHWYQGPAGFVTATVSGFVFGAAYLVTRKNLWVSILAHGFSDSLALVLGLLASWGRYSA
ncbi:MAG TPA: CPBP family intramembrane glutamic endopeptidase [Caulobacteraceae bacterium]|nr:CPBP family intramembrane glutamic endopeptidase [Caulobacteraceae bacterium]